MSAQEQHAPTDATATTTAPDDGAGRPPHRASYSPQDDKLRLFFAFRIPRTEWDELKAAGFTWTMKQASDMCAPWTPAREDLALRLAGEIDDEDEPREDRSADRAERFIGYGEKREGEAEALADRYDAAPRVHGAQDTGRAERAAARHDRIGARAADRWSTAEYWTTRTRGVIAHALYLERADVRHRRIKGIEAEIRGLEKSTAEAAKRYAAWLTTSTIADPVVQDAYALRLAGSEAGTAYDFQHPTNPARRPSDLYGLLRPDQPDADRITGATACALYLGRYAEPGKPDSRTARWLAHLRLRLEYENQMLAAVGGTLANAPEIVPGGFLGRHRVVKVSKDRAGRVSRVYVMQPRGWGDKPETLVERGIRAEKFDPDDYRPPTPEELAEFLGEKRARSAAKPKAPPLVNPDDASAEALQAEFNRREGARGRRADGVTAPPPSEILRMDSAAWARASAGSYARAGVETIRQDWTVKSTSNMWSEAEAARNKVPIACRVRLASGYPGAKRVVILTDKPRGPLPELVQAPPAAAQAAAS